MTNDENNTPEMSEADELQEEMTSLSVVEFGRRCSEQERRYCEQRVFHMKNMKESLRAAGSKAAEKYLSKLAWETENRPHVQQYLQELKKVRTTDANVATQEIIYKTRRAIDSTLLGKTPEKAEPLLRLMAEIAGILKPNGTPTTNNNVLIKNGGGNNDPTSNKQDTLEGDLIRFQQLTGSTPEAPTSTA